MKKHIPLALDFGLQLRDADGFIHLQHKVHDQDRAPKKEKPKAKKVKSPKFKKGTWRHWLYKKLRDWKSSKFAADFHFEKRENILIACKKDPEVVFFNRKLDKGTLKELKKLVGNDAFVLVDSYDKTFMQIPIESYLKLMTIEKMIISFRLRANNDDVEIVDVYEREDVIDNINDLAHFINYHRQGIEGVYEIQSNCCCFTTYDFIFKIVVMKVNGEVETYKGDMNDFMKAYGLHQF